MPGVGETAVVQPNGAVGVPVIAAAAAAAKSSTVAAPSSTTTSSAQPAVSNPSISAQAQESAPAESTIQHQVLAPAAETPAPSPEVSAASPLPVTPVAHAPVDIVPSNNVQPSADPSQQPAPALESTSSAVAQQGASSQSALPAAAVVSETTALPAPLVQPAPAAVTTDAQDLAMQPPVVSSSNSNELSVVSSTESQALVNPAPTESTQTGSQASALGNANVFAPAASDVIVTSSVDPGAINSAPSSSKFTPPVQDSEVASDTSTISSQTSNSQVSSTTLAQTSSHTTSATSSKASSMARSPESTSEATPSPDSKSKVETTAAPSASLSDGEVDPNTTFVSGSVTLTGAAAVSAAEFAHDGGHEGKIAKHGVSSFAIIGIVGGILVFFIIMYIVWFQWRKRRSRDDESEDDDYAANENEFDPYGLAKEKHSGFDFIDQPLSSRFTDRHKSTATGITANPFADPDKRRQRDRDGEREEYVETWYSDPGEAGLGTAKSQQMWYDDRRPSYIDGPQSIYHETNDPSDPFNQKPEGDDRPRSVPAAPPVPPLPAVYRKSSAPSRPRTDFSYGDFYGGYDGARSRPGTQYTQYTHDHAPGTPSTGMATPNTAAMLPWLHPAESPPLPSPADPRATPARKTTSGFGSQPKMPLRGPVAAAMAQTPQMPDRGYQGVIPTFR